MNKLEKIVYDAVKRNPKIKFFLRDTYQSLCDVVPVKSEVSSYPITAREGFFFGFHDKVPFSADDTKLLAGKYDIPLRMPTSDDPLSLGYFDGDNYEQFHEVTKTRSWNWHQGCHLQWRGLSNEMVFNDFDGDRNIARIVNVDSGECRDLSQSISSVSLDGAWAVGYSFERVQRHMPGYGYLHGHRDDVDDPIPDSDGLYHVDLNTGKSKLIVSIAQVAGVDPDSSMDGGRHYISHAIISPNNKRVMFLHRWIKNDLRGRWSRMFSCDLDGKNLYRFPTHEMVSHMGWKDGAHILAYCRLSDNSDGYVLFEDENPEGIERVGCGQFNSDGHPSYEKSGRWIVMDSYPDRFRRQSLMLYDTIEQKRHDIACLKQPKNFATVDPLKHWACDLHPRWNRAGTMVCFDSTYTGKRSLCTMNVAQLTKS